MAYRFSEDDVTFLVSGGGDEALRAAAVLDLDDRSLLGDLTRLRRTAGRHAAAVAETVRLRRRAAQRWGADHGAATPAAGGPVPGDSHPSAQHPPAQHPPAQHPPALHPPAPEPGADTAAWRSLPRRPLAGAAFGAWLFTDDALQQAPPPPVAAHRAARLGAWCAGAGIGVHDVTCSVAADLAALLAAGIPAVGSDIDPVRLAMARHNLAASGLPARLLRADARTRTTRGMLRYGDPARRDVTGRRISSADTIPPLADIDAADPAHPAVLRLPPGIDYPALDRPGEIEIVSLGGVVREAVSWPPPLASAARRATVLDGDGIAEQLTDAEPDDVPVTGPGAYLVDPDPAVVRAHLVRQYAARHGLTLLDEHVAYLTGPVPPPGIRAFQITDAAPFAEGTVRDWLRRDGVGTLEIKQRGTPVIPDDLRRRVRPSGDTRVARTLVIARIGRAAQAFWCRAIPAAHDDRSRHTVVR